MLPSSAQAYTALSDYEKTRKNSQQLSDEANQKYDIGGAQTRVSRMRSLVGNLQNSVEAVDPSVSARTQGGLTTEAQRSALVSRERQPILGDLAKQQDAYGQAQGDWTMANQLAGEAARLGIAEDANTYGRLKDSYGASLAAEQAAEEKRRWEAQQAMAREQAAAEDRRFQQQLAASRASAATPGYGLGDIDKIIKDWQKQSAGGGSNSGVFNAAKAQENAAKAAAEKGRFSPSQISMFTRNMPSASGLARNLISSYNPLLSVANKGYSLAKRFF